MRATEIRALCPGLRTCPSARWARIWRGQGSTPPVQRWGTSGPGSATPTAPSLFDTLHPSLPSWLGCLSSKALTSFNPLGLILQTPLPAEPGSLALLDGPGLASEGLRGGSQGAHRGLPALVLLELIVSLSGLPVPSRQRPPLRDLSGPAAQGSGPEGGPYASGAFPGLLPARYPVPRFLAPMLLPVFLLPREMPTNCSLCFPFPRLPRAAGRSKGGAHLAHFPSLGQTALFCPQLPAWARDGQFLYSVQVWSCLGGTVRPVTLESGTRNECHGLAWLPWG